EGSLMYTTLLPLNVPKLRLYPEIGVNYWSRKVSDYYFGVNADETMHNGVTVRNKYDVTGDTKNYFLGYSAAYPLNKHWGLTHSLRKTWYDDQILDSPVVDGDKASDLRVMFGLTYDF
ncbi:MAG: MipA/OmpV family protein, partial [Leucothrix sp.]